MRRRHLAIRFLITAILATPMSAAALPRPEGAGQPPGTATETQIAEFTVSAVTGETFISDVLQKGRIYRFSITGAWRADNNACHQGDMAFTTPDCWVSRSKTGPGLVIDGVRQSTLACPPLCYRSDHKYSVGKTGEGRSVYFYIFDTNYTDNAGGLNVKIFQISQVTWQVKNSTTLPSGNVPVPTIPTTTVAEGVTQTVILPGQTITVAPVPLGVSIETKHDAQGRVCLYLNGSQVRDCVVDPIAFLFGGRTPDQKIDSVPPQCGGVFQYPLCGGVTVTAEGLISPTQTVTAGPARVGPCGFEVVGMGATVTAESMGFQGCLPNEISTGAFIPPGTEARITLTWTADLSHLFIAAEDPFLGTGSQLWAPFNHRDSAEYDWFFTHLDAVGALIEITLVAPDGKDPDNEPEVQDVVRQVVPGMGQFLEAMFASKACAPNFFQPSAPVCTG